MPKYFDGEVALPFEVVRLTPDSLTSSMLDTIFQSRGTVTIAVSFLGFDSSCLGYVTNVRAQRGGFDVLNITGQAELFVTTTSNLAAVIRHVSGVEYIEEIQNVFHCARNNIGSRSAPTF